MMRTTLEYLVLLAILGGVLFVLWLATEFVPHGGLWFITVGASVIAYKACTKLGWLALVLIPFFPFLIFTLELELQISERYPFGIAIATWSVFALAAILGAWRWWKGLRSATPSTQ